MASLDKNWVNEMRHTASHVLAHAVKNIFGDKVKFGIGPVIENGFYYDFELPSPISDSDLPKIEKEMKKIIARNLPMEKEEFTVKDALEMVKKSGQTFKTELIQEIKKGERDKISGVSKGKVTFYQIGDFVDLCKGGHLKSTGEIPADAFKLTHTAGAYWKGDEKNPMLTRIYGLAFAAKKELDDHLKMLEEAKKRDHKKLGPELELFMFHETAPGMPYWLPKGVILYNQLIDFWRKEHAERDYKEIVSPLLNKKELYVTSGHYEHYWENMFVAKTAEKEEYGVKAMNCPNAHVVYSSKPRSYRDLPLRLSDTDTLHRFELSGTLNGLLRVREFRQDDAHIYVSEEQIESEYEEVFKIVERFYSVFGMEYAYRMGTRPEKFMGDVKIWDRAEKTLEKILKKSKRKFTVAAGDGAFYGPKVDIIMKDALGREWQLGTIQLDFQQPLRFGLEYAGPDGKKKTPVAIHRVVYGSLERFIAILIEHFAGAFPTWIAPVQVIVLPISDTFNKFAERMIIDIKKFGVRAELDSRSESLGKKIREAEKQKIPYMLILGKNEELQKTVSVRQRGEKDMGSMKLEEFLEKISKEIKNKIL